MDLVWNLNSPNMVFWAKSLIFLTFAKVFGELVGVRKNEKICHQNIISHSLSIYGEH